MLLCVLYKQQVYTAITNITTVWHKILMVENIDKSGLGKF